MRKTETVHHLDSLMLSITSRMISDLSPNLPERQALLARACIEAGDVAAFRNIVWPSAERAGACIFKSVYQIQSFWKRYIFANDVYTPETLEAKAYDKFVESQATYGLRDGSHPVMRRIIARSRQIVSEILGPFGYTEWLELAKFGSRAAKGLPGRRSFLDERCELLTGTKLQRAVWKNTVLDDTMLRSITESATAEEDWLSSDICSQELDLKLVPKSYKSMRSIAPDTIIGGFYSQGLGRLVRRRLEASTHLNLKTAQMTHRRLAKQASERGHLVTADLSAASDSFTWEHAKLLLPSDWRAILRLCRVPYVKIPNHGRVKLNSLMLMGSGHTFPLQTLLFYALLKSIADDLGITTKVWVYGDDLIYHRRMHKAVCWVFERFGLTLNKEKTFADGLFRESCGGDYYHGVDVRPYMPEGGGTLPHYEYVSFCYKLLNGLLNRWHEHEIPTTVSALLREILRCTKSVLVVRDTDPEGSGLRHCDLEALGGLPVSWPEVKYTPGGNITYVYGLISEKRGMRAVKRLEPYLWNKLRSAWLPEDLRYVVWHPIKGYLLTCRDKGFDLSTYGDDSPSDIVWIKGIPHENDKRDARYKYTVQSDMDSVWSGLSYYKERWLKTLKQE